VTQNSFRTDGQNGKLNNAVVDTENEMLDVKTHIENAHKRRTADRPACRPADRPDMQVRKRFLSHTNVAWLCDKQFVAHENAIKNAPYN
jgi:hypothetical protein